jgi:hypothetical protein
MGNVMRAVMQNHGSCRKYALAGPPPAVFQRAKGGPHKSVPVFEPYDENLPLQSGYYSFVIDEGGRFHVITGNTRSHAGMINGRPAAAAGRFRISRIGKVAEVYCDSTNYFINYKAYSCRQALYVISAFVMHSAFDVSPFAFFSFKFSREGRFHLSPKGDSLEDIGENQRQIELEELDASERRIPPYTRDQLSRYAQYVPAPPSRLYSIHEDQLTTCLEIDGLAEIDLGLRCPRLSPHIPIPDSQKPNFVIDEEGWLILGVKGHHILSGGVAVGGAGHLILEATGEVAEIHLNFSGHYRPTLDGDYARYAYVTIVNHPLMRISENCIIKGRLFPETSGIPEVHSFSADDLLSEDSDLDMWLEAASL